jgi:hypothetical protein
MKKIIALFTVVIIGFMACDSNSEMKTAANVVDEQVKDTVPVLEEEPLQEGEIAGVYVADISISILFTDSRNVSVFDPNGKGWLKDGMKVSYVIPGEEKMPAFVYKEGRTLNTGNDDWVETLLGSDADLDYLVFRLNTGEDDTSSKYYWLSVHPNIFDKSEFRTTLLTFPDGSVDTVVCQLFTPVTNQSELKYVWYNDALVFSYDKYDPSGQAGTYPDGSVIYNNREFQIIK